MITEKGVALVSLTPKTGNRLYHWNAQQLNNAQFCCTRYINN